MLFFFVKVKNTFTNYDDEVVSTTVAYEWSRSVYGCGQGRSEWARIVRSGFRFKCLRACSCKIYDGFKWLEGAKVRRCKLRAPERETAAVAGVIEGFIIRFICRWRKSIGRSLSIRWINQRKAIKAERLINLVFGVHEMSRNTRVWAQGRRLILDLNTARLGR